MRYKLEAGVGLSSYYSSFFPPREVSFVQIAVRASLGETLQGKAGVFPAFHVSGCPFYF